MVDKILSSFGVNDRLVFNGQDAAKHLFPIALASTLGTVIGNKVSHLKHRKVSQADQHDLSSFLTIIYSLFSCSSLCTMVKCYL